MGRGARRLRGRRQLLSSGTLWHWWAVDNEVLDQPKLSSLPLGVMDALELGVRNQPNSVSFHANVSAYVSTLLASQRQPKSRWLMMQMTETHPERRRVRQAITAERWGDGEMRLTPESRAKMRVREYLMALGQHRFVLSPRGNGLDAHRTWEALLVGAIPIVRSSALNPLYDGLPVLIVNDWPEVTPALLREFLTNYTIRKPLYQVRPRAALAHHHPHPRPPITTTTARGRPLSPLRARRSCPLAMCRRAQYEKLFGDYWIGQFGVERERCLAEERARRAPRYIYDYSAPGGWVALDGAGARTKPPVWTGRDAARGG
jgi:hypothetical protein